MSCTFLQIKPGTLSQKSWFTPPFCPWQEYMKVRMKIISRTSNKRRWDLSSVLDYILILDPSWWHHSFLKIKKEINYKEKGTGKRYVFHLFMEEQLSSNLLSSEKREMNWNIQFHFFFDDERCQRSTFSTKANWPLNTFWQEATFIILKVMKTFQNLEVPVLILGGKKQQNFLRRKKIFCTITTFDTT